MKYLSIVIALSAGLYSVQRLQADPMADFSLTPERIAVIFRDHLDSFPKAEIPQFAHHFLEVCRKFRFDPAFVLSVIQVESSFRVEVASSAGAIGLMQVMPATGHKVARDLSMGLNLRAVTQMLKNPYFNVLLGVAYLAHLRDHYGEHSPYYILAAYNLGPARLDEIRAKNEAMGSRAFKGSETYKYFESILRGVRKFRFYKDRLKANV